MDRSLDVRERLAAIRVLTGAAPLKLRSRYAVRLHVHGYPRPHRRGPIEAIRTDDGEGTEFRAIAVMACDDEVIPLQHRIESVADESDLEDVYNTEPHLLYVACTRARDYVLVTGVGVPRRPSSMRGDAGCL